MKDGVKIYDYMLYAKQRWRERLFRWLGDDPQMDKSVTEPLQTVNHLAFSPQFYFIETYYSYGMLMLLVSVTILLRWKFNPFDDPAMLYFIVQQLVCNLFLDKTINIIISQLLWKPRNNAVFRAFSRSVETSLVRKDYVESQTKFRQWFFEKHTDWTISKLQEVFTPRALQGYRKQLSDLYQKVLALQPTHVYKVPPAAFPPKLARDELPPALRDEIDASDSSDSEERDAIMDDAEAVETRLSNRLSVSKAEISNRGSILAALRQGELPELENLPSIGPLGIALPGSVGAPTPLQPALERSVGQALTGKSLGQKEWLALLDAPEDSEELPISPQQGAGYGRLSALIGRGWLATARRRVMMTDLAHSFGEEIDEGHTCYLCNRTEPRQNRSSPSHEADDDQVDLELQVEVVGDMRSLCIEFENNNGLPEIPFHEDLWRSFLERNDVWKLVCRDCRRKRDRRDSGSQVVPQARPALSSDSMTSEQDTPDGSSVVGLEDQATRERGQRVRELEDDWADEVQVPVEWRNATVPMPAREQMLYWARLAKMRVRRLEEWRKYREMIEDFKIGDQVVSLVERPSWNPPLRKGAIGTIIEIVGNDQFLIEFQDCTGRLRRGDFQDPGYERSPIRDTLREAARRAETGDYSDDEEESEYSDEDYMEEGEESEEEDQFSDDEEADY